MGDPPQESDGSETVSDGAAQKPRTCGHNSKAPSLDDPRDTAHTERGPASALLVALATGLQVLTLFRTFDPDSALLGAEALTTGIPIQASQSLQRATRRPPLEWCSVC